MNQDDMVPLSDLRPGDMIRCGGHWWPVRTVIHKVIICGPDDRGFAASDGCWPRQDITFAEQRGKPEEK